MIDRELLEAIEHELTMLHGLYVTDQPNAYADALRDGLDGQAAAKCVAEVSWFVDEIDLLARIREALQS